MSTQKKKSVPATVFDSMDRKKCVFTLLREQLGLSSNIHAEIEQVYKKYVKHETDMEKIIGKLINNPEEHNKDKSTTQAAITLRRELLDHQIKAAMLQEEVLQKQGTFASQIQHVERILRSWCDQSMYDMAHQIQLVNRHQELMGKLDECRIQGTIVNIGYPVPANRTHTAESGDLYHTAVIIPLQTKQQVLAHIKEKHKDDQNERFALGGGSDTNRWDWYNILVNDLEKDIKYHAESPRDTTDWRNVQLFFDHYGDTLPACEVLALQLDPLWIEKEVFYERQIKRAARLERQEQAKQLKKQKEEQDIAAHAARVALLKAHNAANVVNADASQVETSSDDEVPPNRELTPEEKETDAELIKRAYAYAASKKN